jgi:TolA-binding protein
MFEVFKPRFSTILFALTAAIAVGSWAAMSSGGSMGRGGGMNGGWSGHSMQAPSGGGFRQMSPSTQIGSQNSRNGGWNSERSNNSFSTNSFSRSDQFPNSSHQSSAFHDEHANRDFDNFHQHEFAHFHDNHDFHDGHLHGHHHDDDVFVSIGAPWYWYGYAYPAYPYPYDNYPPEGSTYNYYSYYGSEGGNYGSEDNQYGSEDTQMNAGRPANDSQKMFEQGLNAFNTGDYKSAADQFRQAMNTAPDDKVLPLAYAQALFADGNYADASRIVQASLTTSSAEPVIVFPRGMYKDTGVLEGQLKKLGQAVGADASNIDLQFLYGYELFGAGHLQEAVAPLQIAKSNPQTTLAATTLLNQLGRIQQSKY